MKLRIRNFFLLGFRTGFQNEDQRDRFSIRISSEERLIMLLHRNEPQQGVCRT